MTTEVSTRTAPRRTALRRTARVALAASALLAAVHGAAADEGGLGDFLSSIFGARPAPQAAPSYAPRLVPVAPRAFHPSWHARPRPLVVRLHPARPRVAVAQTPAKPGKVSIFEDRTLRRGDAVMTAQGVRVFAGSDVFPYRSGDFVSLKDATSMDRDASRQLAQLDKLPRG